MSEIPDFIDLEKAAKAAGLQAVPKWAKELKRIPGDEVMARIASIIKAHEQAQLGRRVESR